MQKPIAIWFLGLLFDLRGLSIGIQYQEEGINGFITEPLIQWLE